MTACRLRRPAPCCTQAAELREVFVRYCAFAEERKAARMNQRQFLKLCRDAGLITDATDLPALASIFDDANQLEPSGQLDLPQFLHALGSIASRNYPALSAAGAYQRIISEHIGPNASASHRGDLREVDRTELLLLAPGLAAQFGAQAEGLRIVFDYYVQNQEIMPGSNWADSMAVKHLLHRKASARFAADFGLIPFKMTSKQLNACFTAGLFGLQGQEPDRCNFQEFLQVLGRAALVAFDYVPDPEVAPHIPFQGNYQTAAKQVWAAFAQQVSLLPELSSMRWTPPHNSRSVTTSGGGAQEAEQDDGAVAWDGLATQPSLIRDAPPLHLSHFRQDWVTRPLTPAMEVAKALPPKERPPPKEALLYTLAGPPQVWHPVMTAMVEERVRQEEEREQARIARLVATRAEARYKHSMKRTQRQTLQLAAGQPIVPDAVYKLGCPTTKGAAELFLGLAAPMRSSPTNSPRDDLACTS